MSPKKYIKKLLDNYYRLFGTRPKLSVWSPQEKGDHTELDMSKEVDIEWIKKYQLLIVAL